MKVSVIIPTLNEERVIGRVIEAIKAQEYDGEVEVIVADGVSKDNTVSIARKHGAKVAIEHTHTISAGRQAGADIASGEIFLYTDADALPKKDWIKNVAKAFEDKNVSAAYGWIVPHQGRFVEVFLLKYSALFAAYISSIIGMDYLAGSNMAIRASAFRKIGGMNVMLTTGEDTDLIKRARKVGKVKFVPSAIVMYSLRRIRNWGYKKYLLFHTQNYFSSHLLGRPASKYDTVRD
ncbi:MAG: glycosyltransferase [Candidatus Micrarchaeia archaeon]